MLLEVESTCHTTMWLKFFPASWSCKSVADAHWLQSRLAFCGCGSHLWNRDVPSSGFSDAAARQPGERTPRQPAAAEGDIWRGHDRSFWYTYSAG